MAAGLERNAYPDSDALMMKTFFLSTQVQILYVGVSQTLDIIYPTRNKFSSCAPSPDR